MFHIPDYSNVSYFNLVQVDLISRTFFCQIRTRIDLFCNENDWKLFIWPQFMWCFLQKTLVAVYMKPSAVSFALRYMKSFSQPSLHCNAFDGCFTFYDTVNWRNRRTFQWDLNINAQFNNLSSLLRITLHKERRKHFSARFSIAQTQTNLTNIRCKNYGIRKLMWFLNFPSFPSISLETNFIYFQFSPSPFPRSSNNPHHVYLWIAFICWR